MFEKINVRASINEYIPSRKIKGDLSLEKLIAHINGIQLDENIKSKLIKLAKTYPGSALRQFKKNIPRYIKNMKNSN